MANEAIATSAFIGVGVPLLLYWLVTGLYFISRDASDRLSHHATTIRSDHNKLKAAQKEGKAARVQIKEKWIVILIYVTLLYEFVALSSFSFLPRIPWKIDVTLKRALTFFIIELADVTYITVFWSIISVYSFLAVLVLYNKRFTVTLMMSRLFDRITKRKRSLTNGTSHADEESDAEESDGDDGHSIGRTKSMRSMKSTEMKEVEKSEPQQQAAASSKLRKVFNLILRLGPQILLEIGFIPSSRMALSIMRCTYTTAPEGKPFMDSFPSIQCWTGIHWFYVVISVLFLGILYPAALWFALIKNSLTQKIQYVPRFNVVFVMASLLICGVSTLLSTIVSASQSVVFTVLVLLLVYNVVSQPALGKGVIFNHWKSASLCGATYAALIAVVVVFTGSGNEWPVWLFSGGLVPLMIIAALLSVWRNRALEKRALAALDTIRQDVEKQGGGKGVREIATNIANLAISTQNRQKIVDSGGVEAMLELCKSDDATTVMHAARGLANLSVEDPLIRQRVIGIDGHIALIKSLNNDTFSADVRVQLTRVLFHLSLSKNLRETLITADVLEVLARNLSVSETEALPITASKALLSLSHDYCFGDQFLKVPELSPTRFLTWIDTASGLESKVHGRHPLREVRQNLIGVLAEMLQSSANAGMVIACGGTEIIAKSLKSKNKNVRRYAGKAERAIRALGVDESVEMDREIRRCATFKKIGGEEGEGDGDKLPESSKLQSRSLSIPWLSGKKKAAEEPVVVEEKKMSRQRSTTVSSLPHRSSTAATLPAIPRNRDDSNASQEPPKVMGKRSRSVRWTSDEAKTRRDTVAELPKKTEEKKTEKTEEKKTLRTRSGTIMAVLQSMRKDDDDKPKIKQAWEEKKEVEEKDERKKNMRRNRSVTISAPSKSETESKTLHRTQSAKEKKEMHRSSSTTVAPTETVKKVLRRSSSIKGKK